VSDAARDRRALEQLVDGLLALAALPVQEERRRLWADHQALRPVPRIPVSVTWEGMPDPPWDVILGGGPSCRGALARTIERDLRRRLWAAGNIPDDHIVWPSVTVPAVEASAHGWGVPLAWEGSRPGVDDPLEARRILPPFTERIDLAKVRFRDVEVDGPATRGREEEAAELTGGRLAVRVRWPDLGHSPFDIAARMCGIENLLVWCLQEPGAVAGLMTALTDGLLAHHARRGREGRINCLRAGEYVEIGLRVHCWRPDAHPLGGSHAQRDGSPCARPPSAVHGLGRPDPPIDATAPSLADEWAYVSAQTASGLGPDLYERLVQPASERLAAPFARRTVYYHGCECLDAKAPIIARLPNLRRFHVSPWSSVAAAVRTFGSSVVLEVHAHPGEVFFGASRADMRRSLDRLVDEAEGARIDLNLSDIHSVNGRPELLGVWADEAREAGARR
jgi:hypothetical protein